MGDFWRSLCRLRDLSLVSATDWTIFSSSMSRSFSRSRTASSVWLCPQTKPHDTSKPPVAFHLFPVILKQISISPAVWKWCGLQCLCFTFLLDVSPASRGDVRDGNLSLGNSFIPNWARILLNTKTGNISTDTFIPWETSWKYRILLGFLHAVIKRVGLWVCFCKAIGGADRGGAWRCDKLLPFFKC